MATTTMLIMMQQQLSTLEQEHKQLKKEHEKIKDSIVQLQMAQLQQLKQ